MRVITTLASALAVFACTQSVWAQGVSDCNAAIVKNNAAYSADLVTKLAFLETITQDSYQKITDGKDIGVTLPIEDIPVTFNGNWNSFQEQRNNVFSHYKYDFASSSAVDWTNSYLSPLSPQLYQTCIDGLHPVGAHIWIRKANPTGTIATIVFSFYTAEGDSKKRKFHVQAAGGSFDQSGIKAIEGDFTGSYSVSAIFTRTNIAADAAIVVNTDNAGAQGSADLEIPAAPKVFKTQSSVTTVTSSKEQRSPASYNSWGPIVRDCVHPDPSYALLTNPYPHVNYRYEGDHAMQQSKITSAGPNEACYEALGGSNDSCCLAAVNFTITASESKDVWMEIDPFSGQPKQQATGLEPQ